MCNQCHDNLESIGELEAQGRHYDGGAYRDSIEGKPQYAGYLSPEVLQRYGQYMLKHQLQSDGKMRGSDNWKQGIPKTDYLDSLLRHVMDLWLEMDGGVSRDGLDEALCGIMFNTMGFYYELIKEEKGGIMGEKDEVG